MKVFSYLPAIARAPLIVTVTLLTVTVLTVGCSPVRGPDKQGAGTLGGAASGAGAGALTGFQVGAGTGPGAAVGAGIGAVIGGIRGIAQDEIEEQMLDFAAQNQEERAVAVAREMISDHYARRLDLHPTRDIFPADLFFRGDEAKLRPSAKYFVREIARMNRERLPWSRLVIASYVKSVDERSEFGEYLARERSRNLVNEFVLAGVEGRRLEGRAVLIDAPLVIDPHDHPLRYDQAVELIPLDR